MSSLQPDCYPQDKLPILTSGFRYPIPPNCEVIWSNDQSAVVIENAVNIDELNIHHYTENAFPSFSQEELEECSYCGECFTFCECLSDKQLINLQIDKRETHPFNTPIGLLGGVRGKGRRRGRYKGQRGKVPPKKEGQREIFNTLEKTRVPRQFLSNVPVANSTRKKMSYYEPNLNIVPGGVAFYVKDWRMNSVYDPDPLVGGGNVSGFTQFSAIWNIYRVDRFRFRYEIVSLETTVPLQFFFVLRDYQPSTTLTTYALCQANAEVQGATRPHILGVLNGQNVYRSAGRGGRDLDAKWLDWINPGTFSGDPLLYRSTTGFSGTGAANPSSIVWLGLVVMAEGSGGTIPNGFTIMIELEFDVSWWSTVTSLPSLQERVDCEQHLKLKKDLEKKCAVSKLSQNSDVRLSRKFVI